MNFWCHKNVLVTGATGFLGFWLTKKLVDFHANVTALVRDSNPQSELFRTGLIKKISVVNGNLESCEDLERALIESNVDTVFHLGAQTLVGAAKKAPLLTFETNIRGTYNLLEACKRQKSTIERIVIASSDKAYGVSSVLPYKEHMPLNGLFPYDVSKACSDLLAQSYFHTYGLPLAIARCGNLFGGGDLNWSRLIPGTIRSLHSKHPPVIRSDGTYIRDYLYVKDAVDAYLCLGMQLSKKGILGEAFNFAPSKPYTVLEIVHLVQEIMDCSHIRPIIQNKATHEIKEQFLTSQKAKELLGWKTKYEIEDALKETVQWYQEYFSDTRMQAPSEAYAFC